MMRSFVTLAETLNMSKASQELDTTRQTIMRHVADLQSIKGQTFFDETSKKYKLTEAGTKAFNEARLVLQRADRWLGNNPELSENFATEMFTGKDEYLLIQEHSIANIWRYAPDLIRTGLKCWVGSDGRLEHACMKKIRPYLILFREHKNGWLCIEVGEKSSLRNWLGWKWAKSSVGTFLDTSEVAGRDFRHITDAYYHTAASGDICYEHICARFPHPKEVELQNVNYQRLIFSCTLPNNQMVLAGLIARTNEIHIDGISHETLPRMSDEFLIESANI